MGYIECKINSKERFRQKFLEGLRIAEQKFADKISREDALIQLYDLMRSFEEYDFHACNSKILNRFTGDQKLIYTIYHDMSISDHGTNFYGKDLSIDSRRDLKFKTKMKFKGALRLFIALARNVIGKDSVKEIMNSTSISFKKFGREKNLKKYLRKNQGEIIVRN